MFLYFCRHLSQCGGTRQSGVRRPRQNKLDTDENPKDAQSKKTAPSPGAIHKKTWTLIQESLDTNYHQMTYQTCTALKMLNKSRQVIEPESLLLVQGKHWESWILLELTALCSTCSTGFLKNSLAPTLIAHQLHDWYQVSVIKQFIFLGKSRHSFKPFF